MPRRTLALLVLILPLLSIAVAPVALVHAIGYTLLGSTTLFDSKDVKFPQVATSAGVVSVSGNANRNDAYLWEKGETALTFASPDRRGIANETPDYSTTHLTYAPNGSLYYLWTSERDRRIYMNVRLANSGSFGPTVPVLISARFPSHFDAVARSDNTLFLFWRDFVSNSSASLRYLIVTINGNVPSPGAVGSVDERVMQPSLRAAAGPNGQIAVGYTLATGNKGQLQAHIAIWNGSGFTLERASSPDGDFADPMPAIASDGTYFLTYRGVGSATDGLYYSERKPDGSWPIARLYKGETDWSSLVVDSYGNLHMFWTSRISGSPRLYYQVKPAGLAFDTSPFDAGSGTYFNVDGNTSISNRIYGHTVLEDFNGNNPEAKYFLFSSDLAIISVGSISIDGGQQYTKKASLPVSFTNVVGDQSTMEVRYHWGSAPTSADAFVKFTNPLSVPAPNLANPSACNTQTLYTQIRVGSAVQLTTNQDSIIFDTAAQATVNVVNPNSAYDPAFTASPTALLKVDSPSECIGLSGGSVSGDITTPTQSLVINGDSAFQTTINLTGTEGLKALTVSVSDLLGNSTGDLARTITYDATKPVLTSTGTVTITADTANPVTNIFASLIIDSAAVTDTVGLYGLVIQNRVTPTGGSPVVGTPVSVPFSAMQNVTQAGGKVSLTVSLSLLGGIPAASQLPGDYSFSAYFVDKAGNRADQIAAQSGNITLTVLNLFKMQMPLIRR